MLPEISAQSVRLTASSVREYRNHQGNVCFVDSVSENLKKKPKWRVSAVFMIPNVSGCLWLCCCTKLNGGIDRKLVDLELELWMTSGWVVLGLGLDQDVAGHKGTGDLGFLSLLVERCANQSFFFTDKRFVLRRLASCRSYNLFFS